MSLFSRNSFGPPRAAHGLDAEVTIDDDLAEQTGRQAEYENLGRIMQTLAQSAKALRAGSTYGDETYLGACMKALAKAKSAVRKAEHDDDDDQEEAAERDAAAAKAEQILVKARKCINRAIEEDEDEAGIEKCVAGYKKLAKALASRKQDMETRKAAPTAAMLATVSAKAETFQTELRKLSEELSHVSRSGATAAQQTSLMAKTQVLAGSLESILAVVAGSALVAGTPPNPPIVTAKAAEPTVDYGKRIASADAVGALPGNKHLQAKVLAAKLGAAKGDTNAMIAVKSEIATAPYAVKAIFGDL